MHSYGVLKLTATSPAQIITEPISLSEAWSYLRLPVYSPTDAAAEALVGMFISAAREQAEALQNRPLAAAQFDLTLDYWPCGEIYLAEGLESVDIVQYKKDDGTTGTLTENTDFIVDTVRGLILPVDDTTWPTDDLWESSAITIRFTVHPPTINAIVKAGMLMLIAAWHEGRLPFEVGASAVQEYPYAVTNCLSWGARPRVF